MYRIAIAQYDFPVGAVKGNRVRVRSMRERADQLGARLSVTPELALCGYPPEDLLYRPGFQTRIDEALAELAAALHGTEVLIGHPAVR